MVLEDAIVPLDNNPAERVDPGLLPLAAARVGRGLALDR